MMGVRPKLEEDRILFKKEDNLSFLMEDNLNLLKM